mgnify:CR=1 FL=1
MINPDISLEKSFWEKGFKNIAGVDEAGRGPWAGPLTAACVVIHSKTQVVPGVRDSKKMTKNQREKAFAKICKRSSAFGIGVVSQKVIDTIGIQKAVRKAVLKAIRKMKVDFEIDVSYVLVDGSKTLSLGSYNSQRIKKGGLLHYSISAASILAKVTRDRIMKKFAITYPQYGFENHVGYGTREHIKALQTHGACPVHRKSFAPIKKILSLTSY